MVLLAAEMLGCALVPSEAERVRVERMESAVVPMANAALEAGQAETAQRLYRRLLDLDAESFPASMGLGDVALRRREPGEAARWYLGAAAKAKSSEDRHAAWLAHGRAALTAGRLDAARESFERLVDPKEAASPANVGWGHNGIGLTLLLEGDLDNAVASMERAVLAQPDEFRFGANLSRALALNNRLPPEDSLSSAPSPPTPTEQLGVRIETADVDGSAERAPAGPASPELEELEETAELKEPAESEDTPDGESRAEAAPTSAAAGAEADLEAQAQEPKGLEAAPVGPRPSGFLVVEAGLDFMQMGAYAERDRAEAHAAELSLLTSQTVAVTVAGDGGGESLHRVRIGPLATPEALADLTGELEQGGYDIFSGPPSRGGLEPLGAGDWPSVLVVSEPVDETEVLFLQAGAYAHRPSADEVASELARRTGHPVRVTETAAKDGTPLYRVRIGPFDADSPLLDEVLGVLEQVPAPPLN